MSDSVMQGDTTSQLPCFLYLMKITFLLNNFHLYPKQKLPKLAMNIDIRATMTATSMLNFYSTSVFKLDIPSYVTSILKIGEKKSARMFSPAGWG